MELPLWLVESLAKRQHVELELPNFYGANFRQALRADAPHLNLGQQSDFYFDIGVQLSNMLEEEADLSSQLLAGFASRFHELLGASLNATDKVDSTTLKEKLTLREKCLFDAGRDASRDYEKWRSATAKIEPSTLVSQPRRRKRPRPAT